MKYIGPMGARKPLTESQIRESQSQGKGEVVILPAAPGKAIVFAPGPFIAYTQDRSTPRPPPSTELVDLDDSAKLKMDLLEPEGEDMSNLESNRIGEAKAGVDLPDV